MSEGVLHRRVRDVEPVAEPSNDLELRALLATGDTDAEMSITWVRIDGHHRRLRTHGSTRLYLVQEGAGVITVGSEPLSVGPGDVVVIPRGTPYHLDGAMTYLVVNQPGFRAGDDDYLEAPAN